MVFRRRMQLLRLAYENMPSEVGPLEVLSPRLREAVGILNGFHRESKKPLNTPYSCWRRALGAFPITMILNYFLFWHEDCFSYANSC